MVTNRGQVTVNHDFGRQPIVLIATIAWAIRGGVNTVGLEMTVFVLGLRWLSQFARNTENLAIEQEPEAFVK